MSGSCEPHPAGSDQAREAAMGDVVCLVKGAAYEFTLTVPKAWPQCLNWERALFQVRFRDRYKGQEVTLDLEGLLGFYESLSQLMEYITWEKS